MEEEEKTMEELRKELVIVGMRTWREFMSVLRWLERKTELKWEGGYKPTDKKFLKIIKKGVMESFMWDCCFITYEHNFRCSVGHETGIRGDFFIDSPPYYATQIDFKSLIKIK